MAKKEQLNLKVNWHPVRCPNCCNELIIQAFDTNFKEKKIVIKVKCLTCQFDSVIFISDKQPKFIPVTKNDKRSYVG